MSEILSLTKVVLRNSAIINGRKNKKVNGNNQILTLFSYLIILIVFSVFSYELMSIGPSIGLKDEMFRPVIFYTILITFGLSFVSCFNIYFLGQNIDTYLAMPIKPTNLFIAYFLATSYYSLLTSFSAISAAFIPYMVVYGFSFYSLIAMIVTIITISTVINSLSFIIGNILAKLFNLASHKQALTIAMTIFLIVCITGSTFYVSFSLPSTGDEITNIEYESGEYTNTVNITFKYKNELGSLNITKYSMDEIVPDVEFLNVTSEIKEVKNGNITIYCFMQDDSAAVTYRDSLSVYFIQIPMELDEAVEFAKTIK